VYETDALVSSCASNCLPSWSSKSPRSLISAGPALGPLLGPALGVMPVSVPVPPVPVDEPSPAPVPAPVPSVSPVLPVPAAGAGVGAGPVSVPVPVPVPVSVSVPVAGAMVVEFDAVVAGALVGAGDAAIAAAQSPAAAPSAGVPITMEAVTWSAEIALLPDMETTAFFMAVPYPALVAKLGSKVPARVKDPPRH